eukprot:CAMPEP_0169116380 /NCGR_PEP_ID=MMETSP1015-20121227/29861_1 /TAXON_ID=342587 /ORGANISM="Karlodinium micrum, Strain CCMP2283" /LENGTH=216 /DNA_ID=CAMNT_0009178927 /DNA_START=71 /DNA_END=721 /DNA_ORIENTATION=-
MLGGSERVQRQFLKTEMCSFHAVGRCKRASACKFAHSFDEIEARPNLTKTSLCKAWQKGQCALPAARCQFAHDADDLRSTRGFVEQTYDSVPKPMQSTARKRETDVYETLALIAGECGSRGLAFRGVAKVLQLNSMLPTASPTGDAVQTVTDPHGPSYTLDAIRVLLSFGEEVEGKYKSLDQLVQALHVGLDANCINGNRLIEIMLINATPVCYED